jgi:coatomer subunit zeta
MFCEIKGVLVFDSDGMKIYGKYYNPTGQLATSLGQDLFEKQLKSKLSKFTLKNKETEVVLVDSMTVVLKTVNSLGFYILGSNDENEIMMASLLDSLIEALEIVYRTEIDRGKVIEELDLIMLTIDETIEEGNILCFDASSIAERVVMREVTEPPVPKQNTKESIFGRALSSAKQAISKSISRK